MMAETSAENTFVIFKPDAIARGLVGEILIRFERAALKIAYLEWVSATKEQIEAHYSVDLKWLRNVGRRTTEYYKENGVDIIEAWDIKEFFKDDNELYLYVGGVIRTALIEYMSSGPIILMVLKGPIGALDLVRRIIGSTIPDKAESGTVRSELAYGNPITCGKTAIKNLIHASGAREEFEDELKVWGLSGKILT